MQQEHEIEMQIWEYLDKQCSEEECSRIAMLISENPIWKAKYQEILSFNETLQNNLEQEHPSLRFTQNIMDTVAREHIAPAAKSYLNKWIIGSIAAFCILLIGTLCVNILLSARWSGSDTSFFARFDTVKAPDLSNSTFLYGFIFLNIIAGLILIDTLLRKKKHLPHNIQ